MSVPKGRSDSFRKNKRAFEYLYAALGWHMERFSYNRLLTAAFEAQRREIQELKAERDLHLNSLQRASLKAVRS